MSLLSSGGVLGILILLALIAVIVIGILILLRMQASRQQQRDIALYQRHLQDEIDRSRQDTVDMVQSSMRHMGEMISRNQMEASEAQNRRLSELNREMNEALRQVSRSIGEMQSLASGVDDLKKVLSNVKTRGILGEVQLGAILEDILSPDQYEENVAVTGTTERVEYAVRFPGDGRSVVYLPIDSKFPGDAYMNLMDAYEMGDPVEIRAARDALRRAILKAAKDIQTKYVKPPQTTDFGIMFLPFEGLYAEVLHLNLTSTLMNDYRVNVAGPTTMAALLNSFRMGFRTMALSERSDEVWNTLAKVSSEFEKFEGTIERTQRHLQMAEKDLDEVIGPRTRQIRRTLAELTEIDDIDRISGDK